jgi:hypothetical protein
MSDIPFGGKPHNNINLTLMRVESPRHLFLNPSSIFGEARFKAWRAHVHIHNLMRLLEAIFEDQKEALGLQYDFDEKRYWLNTHMEVFADVGLIVGDCLRNLRSALDYLTSILARQVNQSAERTRFPIDEKCGRIEEFFLPARTSKRGKHLAPGPLHDLSCKYPELKKIILDDIKPYSAEYGGSALGDLIWRVVSMDNIDKHRLITPVVHTTLVDDLKVAGFVIQQSEYHAIGPRGVHIGRMPFDPNAKANMTVAVEFGEDTRLPGEEVTSTLVEGLNAITSVIDIFERHFEGKNTP